MNKKRNPRRAVVLSMLTLLLCASMLVSSTFAWFTDTDTVSVSNVVAGTLDIEIVDEKGEELKDGLKFKAADNRETILWEPGATYRTQGFKLKNVGDLWLKYKMEINNNEVSYNKLNEVIEWSVVYENGEVIDLAEMVDIPLEPEKTAPSELMYIQGKMKTTAGNEYQGLTLTGLGITVYAKQHNEEVDMTGPDYDKDAEYAEPVIAVANADDFIKAFSSLKNGGAVSLTADIDMTGKSWTPVDNKSFTLNGGGYTITGLNGGMADHTGSSEITIKNVTFAGLVDESSTNYAGLLGDADTCSYINMSNVTITGAKIDSAKYAAGFVAYTSGYGNDYDGPVFASHNFTDCKLVNSTVTGEGSTGGLIGHAGGNKATTTTIKGFEVSGSTITGGDAPHTGTIIGTSHVGEVYLTYDEANVQTGNIIGRFVVAGSGKLVVNGEEKDPFNSN